MHDAEGVPHDNVRTIDRSPSRGPLRDSRSPIVLIYELPSWIALLRFISRHPQVPSREGSAADDGGSIVGEQRWLVLRPKFVGYGLT
jgi:hypothetical protein